MAKIESFKDFSPKGSQSFLIDNSVLLYAFAPIGNYNTGMQASITKFLTDAKRVGAGLVTTSLVLSEFYNVVFKDFFLDWKEDVSNAEIQKNLNKTQVLKNLYRPSESYKNDVGSIVAAINNILKLVDKFNDHFNSLDINSVLSGCYEIDFNDSYFIEIANEKNWHIVTRDNDIINSTKLKGSVISFL